MRRLTGGRLARLREERGGIAVMLALLMPILFGAAALGIDTAAVWSARQQVQTGADAAVIAVAMDCARGNCGDIKKTAEDAFWANDKAAKVSDLGPGEGWIAVNNRRISATQKRPWLVNHFFAAAIGFDTGSLSVSSYAQWAPAVEARSPVPVAISYCTYLNLRGSMSSSSATGIPLRTALSGSCTVPGTGSVTGGTAVAAVSGGTSCGTASTWKGSISRYGPDTGLPAGCTTSYLQGLAGRDVAIPVFDRVTGTGASSTYRVYGYAAFRVTSYSSSTQTLNGYFTWSARQIDSTTPPNTTAPDLGARSVFLTEN